MATSQASPSEMHDRCSQKMEKVFLWVNKDPKGIEIDRADSSSITSHVSRNHRKWLKQERQRKLNASRRRHIVHLRPSSALTQTVPPLVEDHSTSVTPTTCNDHVDSCESEAVDRTTETSNTSAQKSQAPRGSDHRCTTTVSQDDYNLCHLNHYQASTRLAITRPYKGSSDPFNASILPLSPERSRALQAALSCFIFAAWPADAHCVFRARIGGTGSHVDLSKVIGSDAELHAILASGYTVQGGADQAVNKQALSHRLRSIELLRERLESQSPVSSILTLIRLLISLDFNSGDFVSARVHLRGIRSLCQHNVTLYENLREVVRTSDVWISMALLSRPDIDPEQHDPGPPSTQEWFNDRLTADQKLKLEFSMLPAPLCDVLGLEIDRLLLAAKHVMCSKEIMTSLDDKTVQPSIVFWTSRRGSATTGGLMSCYASEVALAERTADGEGAQQVHCARAASALLIILYMNFHWMDKDINYDYSQTFRAIDLLLLRCSLRSNTNSLALDQVLLWATFICAMGDDVFAARGSLPFSGWAAAEFLRYCHRLRATTFSTVRPLLQDVAYSANIMDEFLGILLEASSQDRPNASLIPFIRWKMILNHYTAG